MSGVLILMQGVPCPEGLTASTDMAEVVGASEVILMVIPTPFVASTVAPLADLLRDNQILVSCTKGILNDTLETPNEARSAFCSASLYTSVSTAMCCAVSSTSAQSLIATRQQHVLYPS